MLLKFGDCIYAKQDLDSITKNKKYSVIFVRGSYGTIHENDICIRDDNGHKWFFGQIGSSECWTKWFYSEKEWERNKKLENLGI